MIVNKTDDAVPIKGSGGWVSARVFESRWAVSWMWLLPPLVVLMAFLLARSTYNPAAADPHKVSGPDYATYVRQWLELFLPPAVVFLTNHLLAQEWQRGTLVQVALRRRLWSVLGERLAYVLLYILALIWLAGLVSMLLTIDRPGDGNPLSWSWQVIVTVFPPALLLVALGLLITHSTTSPIAGYVVTIAFWLANLLLAPLLRAQHHEQWLIYSLNGWTNRVTEESSDWLVGKLILLGVAVFLLLLQVMLLRDEARFVRYVE